MKVIVYTLTYELLFQFDHLKNEDFFRLTTNSNLKIFLVILIFGNSDRGIYMCCAYQDYTHLVILIISEDRYKYNVAGMANNPSIESAVIACDWSSFDFNFINKYKNAMMFFIAVLKF